MELDPSSRGKAAIERLDVLKKGNKFTRNALLGRFLACICTLVFFQKIRYLLLEHSKNEIY